MLRKLISLSLVIAFVNVIALNAFAKGSPKDLTRAEVKEKVLALGIGESAKVTITLKDNSKIAGHVTSANEDSFTVVGKHGGGPSEIEYSQVKKLKGSNLSTGAKIAIGVGVGIAALVIAFIAKRKVCTVWCQ